jgi:hypothetical protein
VVEVVDAVAPEDRDAVAEGVRLAGLLADAAALDDARADGEAAALGDCALEAVREELIEAAALADAAAVGEATLEGMALLRTKLLRSLRMPRRRTQRPSPTWLRSSTQLRPKTGTQWLKASGSRGC